MPRLVKVSLWQLTDQELDASPPPPTPPTPPAPPRYVNARFGDTTVLHQQFTNASGYSWCSDEWLTG